MCAKCTRLLFLSHMSYRQKISMESMHLTEVLKNFRVIFSPKMLIDHIRVVRVVPPWTRMDEEVKCNMYILP